MADNRTLAQFFFEVGYAACWADAFIANDQKPPFELSDALIERAWAISVEAHEDAAEIDAKKALAEAAPDLLEALQAAFGELPFPLDDWDDSFSAQAWRKARAAIARATPKDSADA